MNPTKINENSYEIELYDWVYAHDDYICGYVKRDPSAPEGSDLRYWMVYLCDDVRPLNAGDLKRIAEFTAKLNSGINNV